MPHIHLHRSRPMDIETLRQQVSIEEVLEHYGWSDDTGLRGWGEWKKTLCPFHNDHNPSASVNLDRGRFKCFTCGIAGDILDIVMEVEFFTTYKEAKGWIEETFLGESKNGSRASTGEENHSNGSTDGD